MQIEFEKAVMRWLLPDEGDRFEGNKSAFVKAKIIITLMDNYGREKTYEVRGVVKNYSFNIGMDNEPIK